MKYKDLITENVGYSEALTIIGVPSNYTKETLKSAYRAKSNIFHPDKPTGNEEMFKRINNANEILKKGFRWFRELF